MIANYQHFFSPTSTASIKIKLHPWREPFPRRRPERAASRPSERWLAWARWVAWTTPWWRRSSRPTSASRTTSSTRPGRWRSAAWGRSWASSTRRRRRGWWEWCKSTEENGSKDSEDISGRWSEARDDEFAGWREREKKWITGRKSNRKKVVTKKVLRESWTSVRRRGTLHRW